MRRDGAGASAGTRPASAEDPDLLLFGERHDAPGQIDRVADALRQLAARDRLAAFAIEMAPAGTSTAALPRSAAALSIRQALQWDDKAWPWERYAPAITAAVVAGVPVLGANLPRADMAKAMADVSLDAQLAEPARAQLAVALRDGHCGLLPESRIPAMLRVQIARDRSMAHVMAESVVSGRTAVLLAGSGHVDSALGVPQHLPTHLTVRSIVLLADGDRTSGRFDATWATPAASRDDPCTALAGHMPAPAGR
ncbi:hypothetical protein GT347_15060 [Xylophilus rhododendri]|uniref:Haem-binding uptake Tiki superfamily ChaN domain-containing protein n=1 Tax=Xylophilus rhododendri TaxID=2697032 RepID=A0A857J5C9_9BURK|nr:ChaN family lipoprotein [Xylophilus rhododendri]QHI99180.1 hypothetical protein GT347_15060 [Xylophilus rhododendri]